MAEPDEWQVVKICEGVEVLIDPTRFEIVGMPMGFSSASQNMRLSFDLNVHVAEGDSDSKIQNILTVQTAR